MGDRVCTRNPGFGFWKCLGEMGLRLVEQGFSLIFADFFCGIFDVRSEREGALQNFKKSSSNMPKNLAKNEENPCYKPIFRLIPGYIPDPSLNSSNFSSIRSWKWNWFKDKNWLYCCGHLTQNYILIGEKSGLARSHANCLIS